MTREEAQAATAERFRQQREDRIEDVEWLLEQRTDPSVIAERLGLTAAALAKSLYRADRPDLARQFTKLAGHNYTPGECRFCGGPTTRLCRKACAGCRPLAQTESINARRAA